MTYSTIEVTGNVISEHKLNIEGSIHIAGSVYPTYTGSYEVTPTQSTQILETANLKMADNVTINPIPSNYGLITWNGSYLTVS